MIADTKIPGIGLFELIKGELTPNYPYSGPLKNLFIGKSLDQVLNRITSFNTLEEAQMSCVRDVDCNGVTQEFVGRYSTRKGTLLSSPSNDISWIKTDITEKDSKGEVYTKFFNTYEEGDKDMSIETFQTLDDALANCFPDEACIGVTQNYDDNKYKTRRGSRLPTTKLVKETSYTKGISVPWSIIVNRFDWTISK